MFIILVNWSENTIHTSSATKCENVDSIKGIDRLSMVSFVVWNGHERYNPVELRSMTKDSTRSPSSHEYQQITKGKKTVHRIYTPMFVNSIASAGPPFAASC